jgi:hypothetical protein
MSRPMSTPEDKRVAAGLPLLALPATSWGWNPTYRPPIGQLEGRVVPEDSPLCPIFYGE